MDPSQLFNRELSWLAFNRRVLELAADDEVPLLERLRFLTICSTNLDEFFEMRVAGLKEQIALGLGSAGSDGLSASETLRRVSVTAHELVADQYKLLNSVLLPALSAQGIAIVAPAEWGNERNWVQQHFMQQVFPVLTPMALDPAHPFPQIVNKSLNFVVSLRGKDAFGRSIRFAVVQAPRTLPRLIALPRQGANAFVLLSTMMEEFMVELFPGMEVEACSQFRVTRNGHLWVDEDEADDLLKALAGQLPRRHHGDAVRLEVDADCSEDLVGFLSDQFDLKDSDVYRVEGPVNLNRLAALYQLIERPDLKYPTFVGAMHPRLAADADPFAEMAKGDLLIQHPSHSFANILDLLQRAAHDPDVVAIKLMLYRTGADSPVVNALLDACRARTEVAVVVELRARFDEAANIDLATRLQEAGANVVYGVVGYKAHAKMLLIVRREGGQLRRYVHLGTGNYHPMTTSAYTDWGLLSADRTLCEDAHRVFMQLTGLGKATKLRKVIQSPFQLHKFLLKAIDKEREEAAAGRTGRIIAKLNALTEPEIVQALYRASQVGVQVDLIIRGICCLRPGVPGLSDNIRVRSILGRFLEHDRVFHFHAAGQNLVYCSSADWMDRNLHRRVEIAFPIEDPKLKDQLLQSLQGYIDDNCYAWLLQNDGTYQRPKRPAPNRRKSAQDRLLAPTPEAMPLVVTMAPVTTTPALPAPQPPTA